MCPATHAVADCFHRAITAEAPESTNHILVFKHAPFASHTMSLLQFCLPGDMSRQDELGLTRAIKP